MKLNRLLIIIILLIYNNINAQIYNYTTNKTCVEKYDIKTCNNIITNFYLNIDNKTLKISSYNDEYILYIDTYYKLLDDEAIYFTFKDKDKNYVISFNNNYKVITIYLQNKTVFFYINFYNKIE